MLYHPSEADVLERDRKQRLAMKHFSVDLYRSLIVHHPRIVKHLQSLPNAQQVVIDKKDD
jgi:hypothetical protein